MKKIVKRLLLTSLVLVFALCAACGAPANTPNDSQGPDFSGYPAELSAWSLADVKAYLTDVGLFDSEKFLLLDLSEGDLGAMQADAGTMYLDTDEGSVFDMVLVYNTEDPDSKAMLDSIIENQTIVVGGDTENAVTIDAVVGNLCFGYLNGYDEEHLTAFVQAIRDLADHYSVEPEYILEG